MGPLRDQRLRLSFLNGDGVLRVLPLIEARAIQAVRDGMLINRIECKADILIDAVALGPVLVLAPDHTALSATTATPP